MNKEILKEVKLVIVDDLYYMVSNDEPSLFEDCLIPRVSERSWDKKSYLVDKLTSNYMVLYPEEFKFIRKVVATPNQIGLVYGMGTTNQMDALYNISGEQISKIFENDGTCWIEYFKSTQKPRLIDGKVIIHGSATDLDEPYKTEPENRSCPCLYLKEPCQPNCTCVNPFMSHGCLNCATYGSIEQREQMAERLNHYRLFYKENKPETYLDKLHNILEHLKIIVELEEMKDLKNTIVRQQKYEEAAKLREEERGIIDRWEKLKPVDVEALKQLFKTYRK